MKGFYAIPKATFHMLQGCHDKVTPRSLGLSLWMGAANSDGTFNASPGALREATGLIGSDWEFTACIAMLNGKVLSLYSYGESIYGVLHGMNKKHVPASTVKKVKDGIPAPPPDLADSVGYQFEANEMCRRTSLSFSFNDGESKVVEETGKDQPLWGLIDMPEKHYEVAVMWLKRATQVCQEFGSRVTLESLAMDFGPALSAMAKESGTAFNACAKHMLTEAEPWALAKREKSTKRLSRWLSRAFRWAVSDKASPPENTLHYQPLSSEEREAIAQAARGVSIGNASH